MDFNRVIHSPGSIIKPRRPHHLGWNTRVSNTFQLCRSTISGFFLRKEKGEEGRRANILLPDVECKRCDAQETLLPHALTMSDCF